MPATVQGRLDSVAAAKWQTELELGQRVYKDGVAEHTVPGGQVEMRISLLHLWGAFVGANILSPFLDPLGVAPALLLSQDQVGPCR